jgi:hypothetical protein
MSDAKHTPGPWTVEDGGLFEAKVLGPKQDGAWPIMFQGNIIDARLIAAAPCLLEALRVAHAALRKLSDEAGDVDEWNEGGFGYEASHGAFEAIQKATGGAL